MHPLLAHPLRILPLTASRQLATVDYAIANRVTDVAADVVAFAYDHDLPSLARATVHALQFFDDFGSLLIAFAVWLVDHVG